MFTTISGYEKFRSLSYERLLEVTAKQIDLGIELGGVTKFDYAVPKALANGDMRVEFKVQRYNTLLCDTERKLIFGEAYYRDGLLHSDDGPAWIEKNKDEQIVACFWWCRGQLHRLDGPACERYSPDSFPNKAWWVNNIHIPFFEDYAEPRLFMDYVVRWRNSIDVVAGAMQIAKYNGWINENGAEVAETIIWIL